MVALLDAIYMLVLTVHTLQILVKNADLKMSSEL